MFELDWQMGLALTAFSLSLTLVVLSVAARLSNRSSPGSAQSHLDGEGVSFLLDGDALVDASPEGWDRLSGTPAPDAGSVFGTLIDAHPWLADRDLNADPPAFFSDPQSPIALDVTRCAGMKLYRLVDQSNRSATVELSALAYEANQDELVLLRKALVDHPVATWRVNPKGQIDWVNEAYLTLARTHADPEIEWPLPILFEITDDPGPARVRVGNIGQDWYDVFREPSENGTWNYALPVAEAIAAEESRKAMMQTLTRAFSDLAIGLAVFSPDRRLALFNPALANLTRLRPDWLGQRPLLTTFFDQLRERRIIGEPKDYHAWRDRITQLESAARSGGLEEDWTLPDGQTFRVSGRSYADGSFAYSFEDVTRQVSQARRLILQMESGQAVLNALADPVIVFSRGGTKILHNTAYASLWADDAAAVAELTIQDATRIWANHCVPTPAWGDIRGFVLDLDDRTEWDARIEHLSGTAGHVRCVPLPGGDTLIAFDGFEAVVALADAPVAASGAE